MKIDVENVTWALRSLAGRIASWIYVSAAAVIALSLQGCNLVTTCPPENLPRYVATLAIVNESSHTVAVSDWVWAETGSMLSRNNAAPA